MLEDAINEAEGTPGFRTGGYSPEEIVEMLHRIRDAGRFNAARELDVTLKERAARTSVRLAQREIARKGQLDTREGQADLHIGRVMEQRDALDNVFNPEPRVEAEEAPARAAAERADGGADDAEAVLAEARRIAGGA